MPHDLDARPGHAAPPPRSVDAPFRRLVPECESSHRCRYGLDNRVAELFFALDWRGRADEHDTDIGLAERATILQPFVLPGGIDAPRVRSSAVPARCMRHGTVAKGDDSISSVAASQIDLRANRSISARYPVGDMRRFAKMRVSRRGRVGDFGGAQRRDIAAPAFRIVAT